MQMYWRPSTGRSKNMSHSIRSQNVAKMDVGILGEKLGYGHYDFKFWTYINVKFCCFNEANSV